jgi:hypothetical protein
VEASAGLAMCLTANCKNGISSYELHRCLRQGFAKVNAQDTSAEPKPDLPLEIAHVLFIDIVGYSKLLINEQSGIIRVARIAIFSQFERSRT